MYTYELETNVHINLKCIRVVYFSHQQGTNNYTALFSIHNLYQRGLHMIFFLVVLQSINSFITIFSFIREHMTCHGLTKEFHLAFVVAKIPTKTDNIKLQRGRKNKI